MDEFFFLFFFIFFLFFWSFLLKRSGVKILTISIPSFIIIAIFVYQYFGFPILFFFLDASRAAYVQDRGIIWEMFLWTSWTITLIMIGFIYARSIFGSLHFNDQYNPFSKSIIPTPGFQIFMLLILLFISVSVMILYLSKVGWGNIAFLSAVGLTESDLEKAQLRSFMGNVFEGKYHRYHLFMRDFLSIISVAFFGQWLVKKNYFTLTMFILSLIICIFSMVMSIEKGPIIWYIISLFLIYTIIKYQGRYKLKHLTIISFLGILLVGLMYIYFMNAPDFWSGISYGISRLFTGQMQSLHHYLTIFPEQLDFLGGLSFPNPRGIFPYEPVSITKLVYSIIFPEMIAKGIVGSSPTFFWGEMYGNFGYAGIIIPPFFVGYWIYWLNILMFKLPMTPIVLSFFIWMILHYRRLAGTSLTNFIIDTDMFIMIILLILFNAKEFRKTLQ